MQPLLLLLVSLLFSVAEAQERNLPFFGASIMGFIIGMVIIAFFAMIGIWHFCFNKKPAITVEP